MTTPHPSGLTAGDRVLFRSVASVRDPIERTGVLIDDPSGKWVRIQYDDQPEPDSALVETLTRVDRPRALDAIADDVALSAERLRHDHPDRRDLADQLSVIASRLRSTP